MGKSGVSLNSLSPRQEKSHTCGQCRFTTQFFINVTSDLLLGAFQLGWGLYPVMLYSWVLACSFKSCIWRHSCLLGGLGDDDEDCLWHSWEGLWDHLDLLLPLNWKCCFHDLDFPVGESSLGHLAASFACGSVEGDWIFEAEWPWEHLLILEVLIKLSAPCRLALAICLFNSCHNSLGQLLCWWWENTPGAKVHSPQ